MCCAISSLRETEENTVLDWGKERKEYNSLLKFVTIADPESALGLYTERSL